MVKRYSTKQDFTHEYMMSDDPDGRYVDFVAYDALAARLETQENVAANLRNDFRECALRAERAEARLAEAERKIAAALQTAGGRWCEWGSRAESVRDILDGTADSADGSTT